MKALLDRARSFKRRVDFESDEYRKLAQSGNFPRHCSLPARTHG